ncbi:MAG: DHH family phosphoesterase [Pyrinomonadaceae bacterium]
MLSQVVELIENQNNFVITTHLRPDGDGIGSSLGLYWLLRSFGKNVQVVVRDEIPAAYLSLPGAKEIVVANSISGECDAVFVIECSDVSRPGIKGLENHLVVNIDHHATSEYFGDINWIDPTAAAVGEMIYNLCKAIGGRVTEDIAQGLYLALVTDTGSFHFPNTTDRTLKVASELVRVGVRPAEITSLVYNSYSWSRLVLMQNIVATLKRDETGRVAWMRQTLEATEISGAVEGDNNGFVNIPLAASDVSASVLMREVQPNAFRASLRSKGGINVAKVAEQFGGGGHKNAAGFKVEGDWDFLERKIIAALLDEIAHADRELAEREYKLERNVA